MTRQVNIQLDSELYDKIRVQCVREHRSVASVARELFQRWVNTVPHQQSTIQQVAFISPHADDNELRLDAEIADLLLPVTQAYKDVKALKKSK